MNIKLENAGSLFADKVEGWWELIVKMVPNLILAIVVSVLFALLAKLLKKITLYFIPRITQNKAVINLITSTITLVILVVGLFIALEILNLDKTVTSILAGAGVIGLALGFAFQEIASNFVSGILIAFKQPYQRSDTIEIDGYKGVVNKINLRTTRLLTFDGLEVLIPNKYLFTKPFTNYSTTPDRRLDINVGVGYESNLKEVEKIAKDSLESLTRRNKEKDIDIFFNEFADSSINFTARVWVNYPNQRDFLESKHLAIIAIKEAFNSNDINIPFPIRTIIKQE
jgi:small conductance mechanosensitive channel